MESLNTADSGSEFFDENGNLLLDQETLKTILSEDESRSDEPQPPNQEPKEPNKGKSYQRYSAEQHRRLQQVYQVNPHPSEKERRALSQELELDPLRVKFWFQNHRSLAKKQQDKKTGRQLKAENEKIRVENEMIRHALSSAYCQDCDGASAGEMAARVQLLRAENDYIRNEISRVTKIVEAYYEIGVMSCPLLEPAPAPAPAAPAPVLAPPPPAPAPAPALYTVATDIASSSNTASAPYAGLADDYGDQLYGWNYFG